MTAVTGTPLSNEVTPLRSDYKKLMIAHYIINLHKLIYSQRDLDVPGDAGKELISKNSTVNVNASFSLLNISSLYFQRLICIKNGQINLVLCFFFNA